MNECMSVFDLLLAECERKENERVEERAKKWKAEGVEWEKASRMAAEVSLHA